MTLPSLTAQYYTELKLDKIEQCTYYPGRYPRYLKALCCSSAFVQNNNYLILALVIWLFHRYLNILRFLPVIFCSSSLLLFPPSAGVCTSGGSGVGLHLMPKLLVKERSARAGGSRVVADRRSRSRSLLGSHPGLKIALRLRRGRSWRGLQREGNRNFRVIFIPCVSLLHPRRDFPVKTFLPFLKFIGLFLPRCALPGV